jgi:hypothetical protein
MIKLLNKAALMSDESSFDDDASRQAAERLADPKTSSFSLGVAAINHGRVSFDLSECEEIRDIVGENGSVEINNARLVLRVKGPKGQTQFAEPLTRVRGITYVPVVLCNSNHRVEVSLDKY